MKPDRVMLDLGLIADAGEELGDEALGALLAACSGFVRAGGVLTWDDWIHMSAPTRAAMIEARRLLDLDRAVTAGRAAHGPRTADALAAPLDDGESLVRRALAESAAEWKKRMESSK